MTLGRFAYDTQLERAIMTTTEPLSGSQRRYLAQFVDAYTARTPKSAAARRAAWPYLADSRSSLG